MALNIDEFLPEIRATGAKIPVFNRLTLLLNRVVDGINQIGSSVGVDASGHTQPPAAPTAINVKAAGGIAHVTLTDSSQRNRALSYFVEADTDPSFPQPHVTHLGASRGAFIPLPGKNDSGDSQPWYFRTYSMSLGSSQRSPHQTLGGTTTPTAINVGGSTQLTPLPSTGSGTASTGGQAGGQGYGTSQLSNES